VASFAALSGVDPVRGGSHRGAGTANYLVGLTVAGGNPERYATYLEIIGPDPEQDTASLERLNLDVQTVSAFGLHTWAVRPTDFDDTLRTIEQGDVAIGDIRASSRLTPSGDTLRWRLSSVSPLPLGGAQPFLIDWQGSPHPSEQPLPAVRLDRFEVRSPDVAATRRVMDSMQVSVDVVEWPTHGLRAELTGALGTFELSSE
jgi:Glyoxalase-like domain